MTKTAIMLGGNLPDTLQQMDFALDRLQKSGFIVNKISKIFHSAAVDCVPGTPDFLDRAVTGVWHDSALELLKLCQKIEVEAGRPAIHSSRESRILDCDIIFFGDDIINSDRLIVPHPRAKERDFVLIPLAEIVPGQKFPDGESVAEKLKKFKGVEK